MLAAAFAKHFHFTVGRENNDVIKKRKQGTGCTHTNTHTHTHFLTHGTHHLCTFSFECLVGVNETHQSSGFAGLFSFNSHACT